MDANFFVDVGRDGDRRRCRHRNQTHDSKGPSICEIRASLGRTAFQHKISRVSLRSRRRLDRVFWHLNFCTPAHRARLSPHPDSDRAFANVPWCALPFGRCLRGSHRDCLRCRRLAIFHIKSAVGYFKNRREPVGAGTGILGAEGVRFELTRPFGLPVFKTGAINRSATPPDQARISRSQIHYSITPLLQVKSRSPFTNGMISVEVITRFARHCNMFM
jgi:hypothetical protein